MWLLNWLKDRASKVLAWFGGRFWEFYGYLSNFFHWIGTYAENAYIRAKNWAWPKIITAREKAKNYAQGIVNAVYPWVRNQVSNIWTWFNARISDARTLIQNTKTWLLSWIENRVSWVLAWAGTKIQELKNLISYWRGELERRINNVIESNPVLKEIVAFLSPENRKRLLDLLEKGYQTITTLAKNPMGYVVATLRPILIELVFWLLAYALGTEEAELPPMPSFSSPGGQGGFDPGPILPPDVIGELAMPLNRISVSGYTFGQSHPGIDLGLANGDPVFAMHAGVVSYTARAFTGYGHQVTVDGGQWWTRYAHLLSLAVASGEQVERGKVIGYGNATGNATGPHLHLEIKHNGRFIDPLTVLSN